MIIPLCTMILILVIFPKLRKRVWSVKFCVVLFATITGAAVAEKFGYCARVNWGMTQGVIIMGILFLQAIKFPANKTVGIVVSLTLLSAVFIHYTACVITLSKYKVIFEKAEHLRNPHTQEFSTLYAELPADNRFINIKSLKKVNTTILYNAFRERRILPIELQKFNRYESRKITTNMPDAELYEYNGWILGKLTQEVDTTADHTYIGGGKEVVTNIFTAPFPIDCDTFQILYPNCKYRINMTFNAERPVDSIYFGSSELKNRID